LSLRLRLFNLLLRISSYFGLSKLHRSENFIEDFRTHAQKSDSIIARFTRNYAHTLTTADSPCWSWVGEVGAAKRYILYFHGSGFCADLPATFRYWADRMASENDASVLLVDYPLAPEFPYPAALNACVDSYRWMVEDQKLDPAKIVIGGDSAGGNLVLATLLRIKQESLPTPACAFALSPCLDLTLSSPSMLENEKSDVVSNLKLLKRLAPLYAPEGNFTDAMVSPMYGVCSGLPPLQLQVGSGELLRDDSIGFYQKFKDATHIDLVLWDGAPHCHQIFGFLPEAGLARRKIQQFIAAYTPIGRLET